MKQKTKNCKQKESLLKVLFYGATFVFFYLLTANVFPMKDDWYYLTAPNPDFQVSDLFPSNAFWRPFDALFGGFLGLFPQLFPTLNRIIVILAHIFNAVILNGILKNIGVKKEWNKFSVCFFLFSSAVWAVTLSPDALNQAFSVLFGVLAIYIHLKKGGYYYLLLSLIALLWKESGVSWFFVVPLFELFKNNVNLKDFIKTPSQTKKFIKQVIFSLLVIGLYFVARFALLGNVSLGEQSGTYKLSVFSFSTIKNFVMLFASACSGVDSVGLLGRERSLLLVGITGLLSLLFLGVFLVAVFKTIRTKSGVLPLLCMAVSVLGLAAPLALLGNSGEMHAYPILYGMAIIFGYCFDKSGFTSKKLSVCILSIFIAFAISSAHKLVCIYDYSKRTEVLAENIQEIYDEQQNTSLFIAADNWSGYSIFDQPSIHGVWFGLSMRPNLGWKELEHSQYIAKNLEDAYSYAQDYSEQYDQIFIVQGESVEKIK